MKKVSKCICVFLIIVAILPTTVSASENTTDRASNFFMADGCYLCQTTGYEIEIWYDVTCVAGMDEVGANKVILQKSLDGSNWTNVKTYTKSDYPKMVDYDTFMHACCLTYTGEPGYYYRAYVQFYAKRGTGSAALDRYTSKIQVY